MFPGCAKRAGKGFLTRQRELVRLISSAERAMVGSPLFAAAGFADIMAGLHMADRFLR
jgi:hypothetical protein